MESVAKTKEVAKALAAKNWDEAFALRGPQFAHAWATYKVVARAFPHEHPELKPQVRGPAAFTLSPLPRSHSHSPRVR